MNNADIDWDMVHVRGDMNRSRPIEPEKESHHLAAVLVGFALGVMATLAAAMTIGAAQ